MFTLRLPRLTRMLPLAAGTLVGMSPFLFPQRRLIFNDAPYLTGNRPGPGESVAKYGQSLKGHGVSHFGGKLDYHQLTFGSFAGMVSGYLFGRISKILVGVIVTTLMGTEYLAAAGHINLRPVEARIYEWVKSHFHQEIFVDDPSFKYSFGAAFLIAAYNA